MAGAEEPPQGRRRQEQQCGAAQSSGTAARSLSSRHERSSAVGGGSRREAQRFATTLRQAKARGRRLQLCPLEQQKLRAETGPESSSQRMLTRLQWTLFQPFLKDKENGRARQVAYIAEDVPGGLRLAFRKPESYLDIAQQARAPGMQYPSLDILKLFAVALKKSVD